MNNLKFVKIEFLTQIVNFYIGSTFSKGPGSAFSEDSCPGLGPIYKVCPINQRKLQKTILIEWSQYCQYFIVWHRAHSRLLVSTQRKFFSLYIKITTLHYFLHR